MITCPECHGRGKRLVYLCDRGETEIRCLVCNEAGQIPDAYFQRIDLGNRMRRERVDVRSTTMRKEAERLGCDLLEWNSIEHGGEPKSDAGRRALAIRQYELNTTTTP